jgi:hypothetical protein
MRSFCAPNQLFWFKALLVEPGNLLWYRSMLVYLRQIMVLKALLPWQASLTALLEPFQMVMYEDEREVKYLFEPMMV